MNLKNEIWKNIVGYEGYYMVSDKGRIKSLARIIIRNNGKPLTIKPKILLPTKNNHGYQQVCLYKDKKQSIKKVHRLVAEVFVDNPSKKPEVNHIDGIKTNNESTNLEWVSSGENKKHAYNSGLKSVKISKEAVDFIRSNFKAYDKEFGAKALSEKFNVNRSTIYDVLKELG
jgi:hypothetical protein